MIEQDRDPSEAELLGSLLSSRDIPCPVCAYNLRGITSETCPECGATLDLRVGSADLKLGPWLVSVIALALPLGFVGTYALIALVALLLMAGDIGVVNSLLMLIPAGIAAGYAWLLSRLVTRRRRIWARPRARQRRLAYLCILIGPVAMLGAIVLLWLGPIFM